MKDNYRRSAVWGSGRSRQAAWVTEEQCVTDYGWHKHGAWVRDGRLSAVDKWKMACDKEQIEKFDGEPYRLFALARGHQGDPNKGPSWDQCVVCAKYDRGYIQGHLSTHLQSKNHFAHGYGVANGLGPCKASPLQF